MSSCWVATRPCRGTRVKYLVLGSFSSNDATEVVLCQEWSLELLALQKTTGTLARAIQQDVPSRIRAIDKYGCAGHQEVRSPAFPDRVLPAEPS